MRSLLPLVDAGAESLKESWLRLLLIDNGFPIPATQIPVFDGGEPFAFLDMGWRDIQLAVEYDGEQHRTSRPQYVKDAKRIPRLERFGWQVIRVLNDVPPRSWRPSTRPTSAEVVPDRQISSIYSHFPALSLVWAKRVRGIERVLGGRGDHTADPLACE